MFTSEELKAAYKCAKHYPAGYGDYYFSVTKGDIESTIEAQDMILNDPSYIEFG